MPKFVRVWEAAEILETSNSSIMVTAHNYKKKHGEYPKWYSTNGERGANKSYVDIEYILNNIEQERKYHKFATEELFWYLTETMNLKPASIARMLAAMSPIYKTDMTWRSFMTHGLFSYPIKKFGEATTRLSEFVKYGTELMESHKKELVNT